MYTKIQYKYIIRKSTSWNKISWKHSLKNRKMFFYCTVHTFLKHVVQKFIMEALDQKRKEMPSIWSCVCLHLNMGVESRHQLITKYCKKWVLAKLFNCINTEYSRVLNKSSSFYLLSKWKMFLKTSNRFL